MRAPLPWTLLLLTVGLTACGSTAPAEPAPPIDAAGPAASGDAGGTPSVVHGVQSVDTDRFWMIIDDARATAGQDDDAFLEHLAARVEALPAEAIVDFARELKRACGQAYRWDLWGAAYTLNGGCSDDGFEYFRCWLVAQGRDTFTAAVADPDSLSALVPLPRDTELEPLLYLPDEIYSEKTGSALPDRVYDGWSESDLGEEWDFEDEAELRARLPRLMEKLSPS